MADEPMGYGKPPTASRFQPGMSGNPGGRPKKLPTLREVVEAELATPMEIKDGGREITVSKQLALIKGLVAAGLGGNQRAINTLLALVRSTSGDDDENAEHVDHAVLDQHIAREVERRLNQVNEKGESK